MEEKSLAIFYKLNDFVIEILSYAHVDCILSFFIF